MAQVRSLINTIIRVGITASYAQLTAYDDVSSTPMASANAVEDAGLSQRPPRGPPLETPGTGARNVLR